MAQEGTDAPRDSAVRIVTTTWSPPSSGQQSEKIFVCRIRENTHKTVIRDNVVNPDSIVFYDSVVLLGTKGTNQTEKELRLVGYRIDGKDYWIATNRYDLTAEEVAEVYKLRWNIETFFGWWKRHLKVYTMIFLEDVYLFFTLKHFSYSLKQQLTHPRKVYSIDNGFIRSVSFKFSDDYGKLLENFVLIELKRRGQECYYWKGKKNVMQL